MYIERRWINLISLCIGLVQVIIEWIKSEWQSEECYVENNFFCKSQIFIQVQKSLRYNTWIWQIFNKILNNCLTYTLLNLDCNQLLKSSSYLQYLYVRRNRDFKNWKGNLLLFFWLLSFHECCHFHFSKLIRRQRSCKGLMPFIKYKFGICVDIVESKLNTQKYDTGLRPLVRTKELI
jgi:hypothetical protein